MLFTFATFCFSFEVNGIVYEVTSSTAPFTVEVRYNENNKYTGVITIPSFVTNNNTTYSVTSIGKYAFSGCSGLTSVTMPNSVTSIGDDAFNKCSGLTSVTIPNSVISIGNYVFSGCSGLTTITIGNCVASIGEMAFGNCSGLTSVTIPNSVTTIGGRAFEGCTGLTSITIGNSVTKIGENAFQGCSNLTSVTFYCSNIGDWFSGIASIKDIVIGNSVTSIGGAAFYKCSGLTSITIPDNVTSIGSGAFNSCSNLTSITIPNSVTSIGNSAFSDCSGLPSITIPEGVTSIGSNTFRYCSGLTSITIPKNVTSIGKYAFDGCKNLSSINISQSVTSIGEYAFDGTAWYNNQPDGLVYAGKVAYKYKGNVPFNTRIVLKEGTLGIADDAFYFNNAYGLRSVTIPNSLITIGTNAFRKCTGLTSINIPNSVTNIGDYAFRECTSLTSITIPNGVTSIGEEVFAFCNNLTSFTIPNSVTSIGKAAFCGCSSLKSVIIGNNVTVIGESAFASTDLTSINIPNSVTSIGTNAFYCCYDLTSVTIPNSVKHIGWYVFSGCNGLKKVTSYIEEPFQTNYIWKSVNTNIPFYVPFGSKDKYKNIPDLKKFTNIIEFGAKDIEPVKEEQVVDMVALPEEMALNGIVIGYTYYNICNENGDKYDAENGCIIMKTPTSDVDVETINGLSVSDNIVKEKFKGIIFMVPSGSGKVSVNAETIGPMTLKVKIGNKESQSFTLVERETVQIPYIVEEPTYIYIYSNDVKTTSARGTSVMESNEDGIKIYHFKWEPAEATAIQNVSLTLPPNGEASQFYYTLDGKRSSKPQRGLNIVRISDGTTKKVVIK